MKTRISLALILMITAVGCQQSKTSPLKSDQAQQPAAKIKISEAAKQRAITAKDALFLRLSGRLKEVLSKDGPAAAINVCSQEASTIAAQVGKEQGVTIGRTSYKLRNPKNSPPDWAREFVEQRSGKPQFVSLENGSTGALLPIHLKSNCLLCHGNEEMIGETIRDRIKEFYPDDQATGFKEGDLRGWFWVEVPMESLDEGKTTDATSGQKESETSPSDVEETLATHEGDGHRHGKGQGKGRGFHGGRGPGMREGMREDMTTLHAMFADRDKINRQVKMLSDGAEAITESDDEEIALLIQEHVPAMENRVLQDDPLPPMAFHPVFVELIKHADGYTLKHEETVKGMKVTYKAKDPFVITLVQEHANW